MDKVEEKINQTDDDSEGAEETFTTSLFSRTDQVSGRLEKEGDSDYNFTTGVFLGFVVATGMGFCYTSYLTRQKKKMKRASSYDTQEPLL